MMWAIFLFEATVKATMVLLSAWGIAHVARRASAAMSAFVWTLAILAVLMLPFAMFFGPGWRMTVPGGMEVFATDVSSGSLQPSAQVRDASKTTPISGEPSAAGVSGGDTRQPAAPQSIEATRNVPWLWVVIGAWAAGTVVGFVRLVTGLGWTLAIVRRATPLAGPDWLDAVADASDRVNLASRVPLLMSADVGVPVACGILRRKVLVPLEAGAWDAERRRVVLLHELSHVKRQDCLVQVLAQTARALHWFNPLVHLATSRLRAAQERACDDLVLNAGVAGPAYATHLCDIAKAWRETMPGAWATLAMARPSHLDGRVRAILDQTRRRVSLSRQTCAWTLVVAPAAVLLLASLHVAAASPPPTSPTIASRLAWFLWNSDPDDELVAVATSGKLNDRAMLDRQVRRMLRDSRSDALIRNVFNAWLYVNAVKSIKPNPRVFPDFDDSLRDAFRQETELFLESQLHEDHGAVELITANYTFVNERLARHYGLANISGSDFRRVTLEADNPRRGLLGQGSILALTSYESRTSPVIRGKYVLEAFLGTPTAITNDMPRFKEDQPGNATLRARMELQQKNARCARCHEWINPLGYALENFDATGQWRTTEGGNPIDPSADFPDGTRFDGPAGLRQYLVAHREQFVGTIVQKLMTYARGRGGEYADIRKIVSDAARSDYRWSSLVLGIVRSTPFQTAP